MTTANTYYGTGRRKSSTARVRLVFDNPDWRLTPGMYAEIALFGGDIATRATTTIAGLLSTGARATAAGGHRSHALQHHRVQHAPQRAAGLRRVRPR